MFIRNSELAALVVVALAAAGQTASAADLALKFKPTDGQASQQERHHRAGTSVDESLYRQFLEWLKKQ